MADRIKLRLHFDAERLQRDLNRLNTEQWIAHFVTQNYDGDWSVIPLRGPASATHPVMMIYSDPTCTEFSNTPFLEGCDYFRSVLESFECPLMAARLMKIAAGSQIKEHTDHDLAIEEGLARLHVPIVTNDDIDFRLNGSQVVMNPGECWYLRLADPHSVVNGGSTDRVHLVIDVQANDWLHGQMSTDCSV